MNHLPFASEVESSNRKDDLNGWRLCRKLGLGFT